MRSMISWLDPAPPLVPENTVLRHQISWRSRESVVLVRCVPFDQSDEKPVTQPVTALEIEGFRRFCARGRSPTLVGDVTGFVTALLERLRERLDVGNLR